MSQDSIRLWETVYSWLRATGNKINRHYCEAEITTHPGYPSLLSIVDFLEIGQVGYKAIRIGRSYLNECNYPLLAHIKDPAGERMHVISDVSEWEAREEVTAHWTGIVIYIDGSSNWENDLHIQYRQEDRNARLAGLTVSFTTIMLFILSGVHFFDIAINAFGLLSLIGLMISVALLSAEMGLPNRLVRHVCGAVNTADCG